MFLRLKKIWVIFKVLLHTLYWSSLIYVLGFFVGLFSGVESRNALVAHITHLWGKGLMNLLKIEITTQGEPISKEPALYVGNHMSYIDIPLFYCVRALSSGATFVAKIEVSKWPIFGYAATSAGTVYVDRASAESRKKTALAMREAIIEKKKSVIIFPEGTSALSGKEWKTGALKMAKDAGILIQPFVIYYNPPRKAAYIDDDNFIKHLWAWVAEVKISATIHFLKPQHVSNHKEDTRVVQDQVHQMWRELDTQAKVKAANEADPIYK